MTYTTQQLQAMSDFEVNKSLCLKLGYDVTGISEQRNMMTGAVIDYCNNPNDIMPLAFERNISLIRSEAGIELDMWCACHNCVLLHGEFGCEISFADTNPLRAIACLLLMMGD